MLVTINGDEEDQKTIAVADNNFSEVLGNLELTEGLNVIELEAEDNVFHTVGLTTVAINVRVTGEDGTTVTHSQPVIHLTSEEIDTTINLHTASVGELAVADGGGVQGDLTIQGGIKPEQYATNPNAKVDTVVVTVNGDTTNSLTIPVDAQVFNIPLTGLLLSEGGNVIQVSAFDFTSSAVSSFNVAMSVNTLETDDPENAPLAGNDEPEIEQVTNSGFIHLNWKKIPRSQKLGRIKYYH